MLGAEYLFIFIQSLIQTREYEVSVSSRAILSLYTFLDGKHFCDTLIVPPLLDQISILQLNECELSIFDHWCLNLILDSLCVIT